jgi:hypothetical protein
MVFKFGEKGQKFYIILEGKVSVLLPPTIEELNIHLTRKSGDGSTTIRKSNFASSAISGGFSGALGSNFALKSME